MCSAGGAKETSETASAAGNSQHVESLECWGLATRSSTAPSEADPAEARRKLQGRRQLFISSLNAGTLANGTDTAQVLAIGAADSAVGTLANLPTPRFLAALVGLPSGDLLAVGGGQHINGAQVGFQGLGSGV